jgi:HlyD family secretion protein
MIKNGLLLLLPILLGACHRAPTVPPGYQGIVELDEQVLAFEVSGRIVSVPVHRGDIVRDGALIVKLDDTLQRLTRQARADEAAAARADLALLEAGAKREDVGAAAADVKAADALVDSAKKSLERVQALRSSGSIAAAELDRAQAEFDRATAQRHSIQLRLASIERGARPQEIERAKARVEAANASLELEEARLARYELHSKSDGFVLDVNVDPGELATVGGPVATIADVTHPYVDVFVPVGSLGGLQIGKSAQVTVDSQSQALPGAIEYVSPRTEFTPRFLFSERERPNLVIRVRVRVKDPERALHAGVPAFVSFDS